MHKLVGKRVLVTAGAWGIGLAISADLHSILMGVSVPANLHCLG
jgi:NAD(P)-dependent dehydrogenase (short-subunit alcohol dehydrogenase family)